MMLCNNNDVKMLNNDVASSWGVAKEEQRSNIK